MAADRFFVAPFKSGVTRNRSPWLIPEDAFVRLRNAYIYHGRVVKRPGSRSLNPGVTPVQERLQSRLRFSVDTTDGDGNKTVQMSISNYFIGQQLSIGDEIFTITSLGNPTTLARTGSTSTATLDTTTGDLTIAGADTLETIYFYPMLPVMGLKTYDIDTQNAETLIAFDTKYAYEYTGLGFDRLGSAEWSGSDSDFFWSCNYRGVNAYNDYFFVTNNVVSDHIKYYDGTTWSDLHPNVNASTQLDTARIVLPFKDRLLALNTVEGGNRIPNRCRYSANGNPIATDAWREDMPGQGSFIDAPTSEAIISAEFLKDRLVVGFERSMWELVYTGNQVLPFRWQQIDSTLGVNSAFSFVPFENSVTGIGARGIHACDGVSVRRIDENIPNEVFRISTENEGAERIHGIREYKNELVYWIYSEKGSASKFPDKILVYNYENDTWAMSDDSLTALGYYYLKNDITWSAMTSEWRTYTNTWAGGTNQSDYRAVVGGNQQGYVMVLNPYDATNAFSLSIADMNSATNQATVVNHNLETGDYVYIDGAQGYTGLNGTIHEVTKIDSNNIEFVFENLQTGYTGGGVLRRITPLDILTKEFNFYVTSGRNASISHIDFYVDRTVSGEIQTELYPSSANISIHDQVSSVGNGVLETSPYSLVPLEQSQDRLWHTVYMPGNGHTVQLRLWHTSGQTTEAPIMDSPFQLHAMCIHATPTSDRLS